MGGSCAEIGAIAKVELIDRVFVAGEPLLSLNRSKHAEERRELPLIRLPRTLLGN